MRHSMLQPRALGLFIIVPSLALMMVSGALATSESSMHVVILGSWDGDGAHAARIQLDETSECTPIVRVENNSRYRGMAGTQPHSDMSAPSGAAMLMYDYDEGRPLAGAWTPVADVTIPPRMNIFLSSYDGGFGRPITLPPGTHLVYGGLEFSERDPYFPGSAHFEVQCDKPFTVVESTPAAYELWDEFEFSGEAGAWAGLLGRVAFASPNVTADASIATEGFFEYWASAHAGGTDLVMGLNGREGYDEVHLNEDNTGWGTAYHAFYEYVREPTAWTLSMRGYSAEVGFGAWTFQWPQGALTVTT